MAVPLRYGVYYNPLEVVGAQVRLVDEVLLDPATGTGAYFLAAMNTRWRGKSLRPWNAPADRHGMAHTTHAFEVLVGPYTVAHLRIS